MKFYLCFLAVVLSASCATPYKSKPTMSRKNRCKGWNDPGAYNNNTDTITIYIQG
jgi:hypothetical protein